MFEWDEDKRQGNIAKHQIDLVIVDRFEFDTAFVRADTRSDYGEVRLTATGFIGDRLHVLIFTIREERRKLRVISLRKANKKEIKRYVDEI
ncbi:conserved hypothetical protein [uncultured Pleomorphomonas sp.]|uniref:BrnT family toxin n=1 Tax=uncultured Pleomorphomonas sp. TaxID=442121 RepID=A0A212L765_9HYPH|nr:BrnT family toxin [uncultured Pleomorphomonas sp.]SCM73413.1 conserved hypothetical protein [uncultured Pleomorphomonas sp.]